MKSWKENKGFWSITGIFLLWAGIAAFYSINQKTVRGLFQREIVIITIYMVTILILYFLRSRQRQNSKGILELAIDYRYLVCGIYFVTFCILGIHGFSTNIWNTIVPADNGWQTKLFGVDRTITSDVWAIGMPQILNQIYNDFPLFNTTIMSQGANMVLGGVPAKAISIIGQPHYWGCFLGAHIGLAWLYWFKKFALLLSSYEVMNYLLREKKKLAMLGALIITTSPLMNWWFGHTVNVVVIYAQWCVACVIMYVNNIDNLKKKMLAAILGVIGAVGFVMGWYPALQVSFGYLILILVIFILIKPIKEKVFTKQDVGILSVSFGVILGIVGTFLYISKDSIAQLTSTEYPGHIMIQGGNYLTYCVSYYFLQPLLAITDPTQGNRCENSTIMPFMPIIYLATLLVLIHAEKKRNSMKGMGIMIALELYSIFLLSRLWIPYPEAFAKYTLFSYVSEARSIWCLAIVSVYLGMMVLAYVLEEKPFGRISSMMIIVITLAGYLCLTYQYTDWTLLQSTHLPVKLALGIIIMIAGVFYYFYLQGHMKIITIFLLILCVGFEVSINPLEIGMGSLKDSELATSIQKIKKEDSDGYWAVDGDWFMGNFVSAQGVHVFNVTNQYMDTEKWKVLDPQGDEEFLYNRYAQVNMVCTEGEDKLEQYAVVLTVTIKAETIENMGVDYILSKRDLSQLQGYDKILTEICFEPKSQYRIYRVN